MKTFRTIRNLVLVLFALFPLTLQAQWQQTNFPSGAEVLDFFAEGSTYFAGTTTKGLYTSNDGGATWTQYPQHTVLSYGGFESLDGKIFCVVGGAGVHVSADMGATWNDAGTGLNAGNTSTIVLCGGNLFALVLNDGIYRSTDKGASWNKVTSSLTAGNTLAGLMVCGNTLFTSPYMKDLYSSSDQGQTWNPVKISDSSPTILTYTSCNNIPFVYTRGKTYNYITYYSPDNGQTWSEFPLNKLRTGDFVYEGGCYYTAGFSSDEAGIFKFRMGDTTYALVNNGLPARAGVNKIYSNGKYMFAAVKSNGDATTKNGVYRIPTSEIGTMDVETGTSTRPEKFELMQNYPNPFNPSTTITYSLPEAGHVRLSVYSLLGKEVATLVDGYQDANVHSVSFNASGLTSGIYFYRIEAGKFTAFKKLLLMK